MTTSKSWFYKNRRLIVYLVAALALSAGIIYTLIHYYEDWTGFGPRVTYQNFEPGRTLWDWLQLLIVPVILALAAYYFTRTERRNELKIARERDETARAIASDDRHERELQYYLDKMTELILEKGLIESGENSEIRVVARARTLTVLSTIDPPRKIQVLRFLREISEGNNFAVLFTMRGANFSGLLNKKQDESSRGIKAVDQDALGNLAGMYLFGSMIIQMSCTEALFSFSDLRSAHFSHSDLPMSSFGGANLRDVFFWECDLTKSDFASADLSETKFFQCNLTGATFFPRLQRESERTTLRGARFWETNLEGAEFERTDLIDAQFEIESLCKVKTLKEAIMPDGRLWEGKDYGPYTVEELEPYLPKVKETF